MPKRTPIFYNALLLTGVNLLLRFVSTSFQVYISGRIGAAGVGLLQLVLSVGAMAMTLGMAGIRTAAMYLSAEELGRKREQNVTWILSGCFLYSILCSGTVSLALYFGAPFLATHWIGDIRTISAIRTYSAFLPVNCLCGVMTGYFTAANRIRTLAAVEVAEQAFSMGITMSLLLFWADSDPARACQCIILGSGISMCLTLLCLVALRAKQKPPVGKPFPVRQKLLSTAVPLALADDLKAGISTAENLMVPKRLALFSGIADPLAAFGLVCGMVFPVLMFPAAILYALSELLIPEFARCNAAGSKERIQYLAKRSLRVAMLYGCLFAGLEFLLSEALCIQLYKSAEAAVHLRQYAFLIPMLYCDAITDAMIKGLGQQKISVRYNILTSAMDVLFLFLLLPHYGMQGFFFSFLITHLINFGLSLRRLLKIVGNIISPTGPILTVCSTLFAVALAGTLSAPTLRCCAFAVILFCLLFLLKILKKEDILWVTGLIAKK